MPTGNDHKRYHQHINMMIETSVPTDRVEVIKALEELSVTVIACTVSEAVES